MAGIVGNPRSSDATKTCHCCGSTDCEWFCGPNAVFSDPGGGGTAAMGIPVVTSGQISDVTITDPGSGYAANASISFTGTHTTAAVATGKVGGVTATAITANGTGYTSAPTVTFSAPGGFGTTATGTATIDGSGHVIGITITSKGSLYTADPTVTFSGGGGSGATATATAGVGLVTEVTFSNHGSGYVQPSPPPDTLDVTISVFGSFTLPRATTTCSDTLGLADHRTPCAWSLYTTVDVPSTSTCPTITGMPVCICVAFDSVHGWCFGMKFASKDGTGSDITCTTGSYKCQVIDSTLASAANACLGTGAPGTAGGFSPNIFFQSGITGIPCSSRPFSWSTSVGVSSDWKKIGPLFGRACPGNEDVTISLTVSEP
jgi:hypothetical protein